MRLVLSDFSSLDGVVQAPGGPQEDPDGGFAHGGWSHPYFDVAVMGPLLGGLLDDTDALLFGRRTFEGMAAAWPGRAGDAFADRMNALPKHVASRTLRAQDLTWAGSQLLPPQDVLGAVASLRAQPGGVLQVMGSPTLARQLLSAGLVDELVLMVMPVLLGGGKRVLPDDGVLRPLELVSVAQASTGVLVCRYRPVR